VFIFFWLDLDAILRHCFFICKYILRIMPVYDSTSAFLRQQFKNFKEASQANKVLREAALYAASAVQGRVQQEGKKSDGTSLPPYDSGKSFSTSSPIGRRFGDVANKRQQKAFGSGDSFNSYKDFRQKLGRQTAYMDLTLTGDMWASWRSLPISDKAYSVAFVSAEQNQISMYLEQRFGPIFELTDKELEQSLQTINRLAIQYLSR
jgi:hypothetical protein